MQNLLKDALFFPDYRSYWVGCRVAPLKNFQVFASAERGEKGTLETESRWWGVQVAMRLSDLAKDRTSAYRFAREVGTEWWG